MHGRIQGGEIASPKTYERIFIHHDIYNSQTAFAI